MLSDYVMYSRLRENAESALRHTVKRIDRLKMRNCSPEAISNLLLLQDKWQTSLSKYTKLIAECK